MSDRRGRGRGGGEWGGVDVTGKENVNRGVSVGYDVTSL